MLVAVFALANLGLVLVHYFASEHDGYEDPADSLFTTYKILILVDVPEVLDETDPTVLWRLVFVLTSVLTSLVLLNLLIARMNDAYERIQDVGEMEERRMKAKLVARYELGMSEVSHPDYFPKFVKALARKGENRGALKKTEWSGVLSEIKENINENKREMFAKIEETKKEMVETKKEMAETKKEMTEMEKKLSQILDLLTKKGGGSADEPEAAETFGGFQE